MDLMDRWGHMYRHEPSAHSLNHAPSGAMIDFMERAIALRLEVLGRYFTREELSQLGFVTARQWQALEDEVQVLLAHQAEPHGPDALQALGHWARLMDQLCRGSATLQARLLAAHAAEPLLHAGGWLSPAVRGFIGAAAAAHAQEHRAAQA